MIFRRPLIAAAFLALASSAGAQPPADTAVTFGNKLSVASVTAALQAAGFQALVAPRPPNMPDVILGVISTGLNGAKGSVLVSKCDNSKTDDVCVLTFLVPFTDDKNILTDALLASLNQKTAFAKVSRVIRPTDNKSMLNVTYSYIVKDFDDTKFIVPVMANFAQDLGRVVAAYTAAATAAPAPAK
jgi:hypothetical protein